MSVSQATHDTATAFTDNLRLIMDTMEEIIMDIPESKYLTVMNALRDLYRDHNGNRMDPTIAERTEFMEVVRETFERNPVVSAEQRRANRPIRDKEIIHSDAWKLKNGYKVCKCCDRIVQNIKLHKLSDLCLRIQNTKKLCIGTSRMDNVEETKAIVKIKNVLLKVSERRGV